MDESIRQNTLSFSAEDVIRDGFAVSPDGKKLVVVFKRRLLNLKNVHNGGVIGRILALEKSHLKEELEKFAYDPAHKSSLEAGIEQIEIIESLLSIVRDPKAYQDAAQTYLMEKDRRGGLPDDSARKAFRAHKTRLANINRTRMDDDERKVLKQRQKNIALAEKLYIALQKEALGIA